MGGKEDVQEYIRRLSFGTSHDEEMGYVVGAWKSIPKGTHAIPDQTFGASLVFLPRLEDRKLSIWIEL